MKLYKFIKKKNYYENKPNKNRKIQLLCCGWSSYININFKNCVMKVKDLAFEIAKKAFDGKFDKGGKPYINHLVRVSEPFEEDDFLYPIAILHDLLEDCPEWNTKSLSCLFHENVVKTIDLLTRKENQDYFDYINKISESSWATKIKLADLKDNMDITSLSDLGNKDFERLQKYLKAYNILTN